MRWAAGVSCGRQRTRGEKREDLLGDGGRTFEPSVSHHEGRKFSNCFPVASVWNLSEKYLWLGGWGFKACGLEATKRVMSPARFLPGKTNARASRQACDRSARLPAHLRDLPVER